MGKLRVEDAPEPEHRQVTLAWAPPPPVRAVARSAARRRVPAPLRIAPHFLADPRIGEAALELGREPHHVLGSLLHVAAALAVHGALLPRRIDGYAGRYGFADALIGAELAVRDGELVRLADDVLDELGIRRPR